LRYKAWYQREIVIPYDWDQKNFTLLLERCQWVTRVWVNSEYAGTQNSLCTTQEYDLTAFLKAGKHQITNCMDNEYSFSQRFQILDEFILLKRKEGVVL
jgi:beta-galactosidase/beta-glucuronidase